MTAVRTFTGPGATPVEIYPDADALGASLAGSILSSLGPARARGRRFLLGCPGGRSLRSTYQALGALARTVGADLSHLVIVMMDEYVLPAGGGFTPCPADAHYSCRRFAREEIRDLLNAGLREGRRVPEENLWLPDPADPASYEPRIAQAGGIDLFLTASGASDGHVAFNPPGSTMDCPPRIIPLPESTRRDNLATFPEFRGLDDVPAHGVSVGLGTIVRQSRHVALVIHGPGKAHAVERLMACRDFDSSWPASVIFRCRGRRILLDEAAAAGWSHAR